MTGIVKNVPFFSHISFEALVSLSTAEQLNKNDRHFAAWTNMWSNSVYLLPSENADMAAIRSQLNALAMTNHVDENYLPLHDYKLVAGGNFIARPTITQAARVFTTETRIKEIGIRKVMGASVGNLLYLLSRGFLFLLSVSALIALPATYFFFKTVVLPNFPYHTPVQPTELFVGLLAVLLIAFIMIGSQTLKAAKSNPVTVLKNE